MAVPDSIAPIVIDSNPSNGDKDIILAPVLFVYFSEPIDINSVNETSFKVTDEEFNIVTGSFSFNNDNTIVSYDPDQSLFPGTAYTLTVTTEVIDLQGNPLDRSYTATFTTGSGEADGLIAFHFNNQESPPDYYQGIYTMDTEGNIIDRLTKIEDDDIQPSWSPDGTRMAFTRYYWLGNRDREIFLMNSDGTFPENLTNNPTSRDAEPDFSPDGSKIAFETERDGNREIYLMNINGTDLVNITNNPSLDRAPSWSPDGSKITFSSDRDGKPDIFVMGRNGENPVNLTGSVSGLYYYPAWSPDGSEIAFWKVGSYAGELLLMNSDGTNIHKLTYGDPYTEGHPLSWSPDGSRIVFVTGENDYDYFDLAIAIINRDGSNRTILTDFGYYYTPDWSPWPIR